MPEGSPVASTTRSKERGRARLPRAQKRDGRPRVLEHARAERSELSGAEHRGARRGADGDLVEDLAGRGERLGEDRLLVGDLPGHFVEILQRKSQELRVRPRMAEDAEHAALRAVASEAAPALIAAPAGQVDLPHDALSNPGRAGGPLDAADELVAGNAGEAVVAAAKLQVRVADARRDDAHERETASWSRPAHLADGSPSPFENERHHGASLAGC